MVAVRLYGCRCLLALARLSLHGAKLPAEGQAYVQGVPTNEMHTKGFVSIGCEPCTIPILPNQHEREGRWAWEVSPALAALPGSQLQAHSMSLAERLVDHRRQHARLLLSTATLTGACACCMTVCSIVWCQQRAGSPASALAGHHEQGVQLAQQQEQGSRTAGSSLECMLRKLPTELLGDLWLRLQGATKKECGCHTQRQCGRQQQ